MTIKRVFTAIWFFFARRLSVKTEAFLKSSVCEFCSVITELKDHYVSHRELEELQKTWRPVYTKLTSIWIPKKHRYYDSAKTLLNIYPSLAITIANSNKAFVLSEIERYDDLFSDIDGKSLDYQQRTVVVTGEDSNLVLAGAGSGKTLTIAGKVKYLCQAKGIAPEDILLISYTQKAAAEMRNRINTKLGVNVDTFTFHKLGRDIISAAHDEKPDVDPYLNTFVKTYLSENIVDKPEEIKLLIEYFAYYLNIPAELELFNSLGEVYDYERGKDLETLKSKLKTKYDQARYVSDAAYDGSYKRQTLKKEPVKSLDEVKIANFLFLNGIEYTYEIEYPYTTSNRYYSSYHPDFYLPEYDIYIEHFGIDRNGDLPWLSPIEAEIYKDGMEWKKAIHEQNNTCLLETYSYYSSEGRLLTELEKMLREKGVAFRKPDFEEIFNAIYSDAGEKYFSEFVNLCSTFIALFKSRGLQIDDLKSLHIPQEQSPFHRERTRVFLGIIKPIIVAYNEHLTAKGAVDFSDMINHATALVRNGYPVHQYKWVIIDEYQDISVARFNLVKAILDQTNAKLLCVGDDWQSIYRFAGSDIALFTQFSRYFQKAEILRIEQTYRNSQQLIDIAGSFITKNKSQYTKHLRSEKKVVRPLVFMHYKKDYVDVLKQTINRIIRENSPTGSILLLGRTSYDANILNSAKDFLYNEKTGNIHYRYSPETAISFLTIHKAKGLEADNVVILNFKNDLLGFPNKIADDPLIGLVLNDADKYPYAEERRLLYVALTRTKNKTYILVDDNAPSEFYKEFLKNPGIEDNYTGNTPAGTVHCPRCKTGHLTIRKNNTNNKEFLGCSHYPNCDFTVSETSILRETRRCPSCGGFLVKKGYSNSYVCTNWQRCSYKQTIK